MTTAAERERLRMAMLQAQTVAEVWLALYDDACEDYALGVQARDAGLLTGRGLQRLGDLEVERAHAAGQLRAAEAKARAAAAAWDAVRLKGTAYTGLTRTADGLGRVA